MMVRMVAAVGLLVLLITAGLAIDAGIRAKETPQRLTSWHSQVVHRPAAEQPVRMQTTVTSPASATTLTWTTTNSRYLTFPCDTKPPTDFYNGCKDVLASERLVLHGDKALWADYKVCYENDQHCAPILDAFREK